MRSRPNSTVANPNYGLLTPPPSPQSRHNLRTSKTIRISKYSRPSVDIIISTSNTSSELDQFGMTDFSSLTSKPKASSTEVLYNNTTQHTYDLFGAKPFVTQASNYTSHKHKSSLDSVSVTSNNNNVDLFGATPFLYLPPNH